MRIKVSTDDLACRVLENFRLMLQTHDFSSFMENSLRLQQHILSMENMLFKYDEIVSCAKESKELDAAEFKKLMVEKSSKTKNGYVVISKL